MTFPQSATYLHCSSALCRVEWLSMHIFIMLHKSLIPIGFRLADCSCAHAAETRIGLIFIDSASTLEAALPSLSAIPHKMYRGLRYAVLAETNDSISANFTIQYAICQSQTMGSQGGCAREDIHHRQHQLRFCTESTVRGARSFKTIAMLCCLASPLLC